MDCQTMDDRGVKNCSPIKKWRMSLGFLPLFGLDVTGILNGAQIDHNTLRFAVAHSFLPGTDIALWFLLVVVVTLI
eukprot:scaffold2619_cov129-Cylindrotheca_fusiformis.AAC.3